MSRVERHAKPTSRHDNNDDYPKHQKGRNNSVKVDRDNRNRNPEIRENERIQGSTGYRNSRRTDGFDDVTRNSPEKSKSSGSKRSGYKNSLEKEDEIVATPTIKKKNSKVDFTPSGILARDENTRNGVPLKFILPENWCYPSHEASISWAIVIGSNSSIDRSGTLGTDENIKERGDKVKYVHVRSCYIFGSDRRLLSKEDVFEQAEGKRHTSFVNEGPEKDAIGYIATDHPSCSRQHAVLQFRKIFKGNAYIICPYILDLGSSNGTFLNGHSEPIEPGKYYELKESDVLNFGASTRSYILLYVNVDDCVLKDESFDQNALNDYTTMV